MAIISSLHVYPIKSLGGIELDVAQVTDRGLEFDRRWMLIDQSGRFLSQREHPVMALLQVAIEPENGLQVFSKTHPSNSITIPFTGSGDVVRVAVWDDEMDALTVSPLFDAWFTQQLDINCRLVYMPDATARIVDPRYASNDEVTSFADAYPILLIGQASLNDLNSRLSEPVLMNRFRPNIVVEGWAPYEEDRLGMLQAGEVLMEAVKPCARCVLTTVDQDTAQKGKEPLKTLASYRTVGKKVLFGQNLLQHRLGVLKRGMDIRFI